MDLRFAAEPLFFAGTILRSNDVTSSLLLKKEASNKRINLFNS